MIVDDDELELVNTTRMHGKAELSHYFVNNSKVDDGHLVAGTVKAVLRSWCSTRTRRLAVGDLSS